MTSIGFIFIVCITKQRHCSDLLGTTFTYVIKLISRLLLFRATLNTKDVVSRSETHDRTLSWNNHVCLSAAYPS